MCAREVEHTKPQHIKLELAKQVINEFTSKGGLSIKWCYLGEPAMYPHLVELLKYAKERGIVDNRIATNGNLLNPKLSKKILEAGVDNIIFSIDSIHPEIYKNIRRNGNLGKVVRNLAIFRYLRDKMKVSTKIQVQSIPFESNKEELEKGHYHEFFKEFADVVWDSPWCKDWKNYYEKDEIQSDFFCPSPFRRLLVRVNGDIWLCCGDLIEEKHIGTFPEMSLEEAWNSTYMKDVRKNLKEGNVHLIDACKKCSERYYKQ